MNQCFTHQQGCGVLVGGQVIFVDSLGELCEVFQDATAFEIWQFFFGAFFGTLT
ncbi:MAG TPA: hypothetical protein VFP49_09930 [Nitrososphaeraceae archaeon]|nr:hypothetical protein [Nitrososphaeraceae archaeon]